MHTRDATPRPASGSWGSAAAQGGGDQQDDDRHHGDPAKVEPHRLVVELLREQNILGFVRVVYHRKGTGAVGPGLGSDPPSIVAVTATAGITRGGGRGRWSQAGRRRLAGPDRTRGNGRPVMFARLISGSLPRPCGYGSKISRLRVDVTDRPRTCRCTTMASDPHPTAPPAPLGVVHPRATRRCDGQPRLVNLPTRAFGHPRRSPVSPDRSARLCCC